MFKWVFVMLTQPLTYRFFLIPRKQGQAMQRLYSYITQEFSILEPYEETDNPVTVLWVAGQKFWKHQELLGIWNHEMLI